MAQPETGNNDIPHLALTLELPVGVTWVAA